MKIHPVTELFPILNDAELRELADDIEANGLQQPIVMQDGVLLDGRNRLAACALVGITPETKEYSGKDVVAYIIGANLHRRHMNESQRAVVAAKIANLSDGVRKDRSANLPTLPVSQPEAAKLLNVSERSVRDAKLIEREAPELVEKISSGDLSIHAAKKIVRPHISQNTGDNEWYTPKPYIEAARSVMGKIDLDPASTKEANKVVQAEKIYTIKNNGLKQDWTGTACWLNPPYTSKLVGKFIEKLAASVESGAVTEAIVLVNNATETKWFVRIASISSFLCFPSSRIKFWKPDKDKAAPLQGQAIAYIGKHGKRFVSEFRPFGIIAEIIHEG